MLLWLSDFASTSCTVTVVGSWRLQSGGSRVGSRVGCRVTGGHFSFLWDPQRLYVCVVDLLIAQQFIPVFTNQKPSIKNRGQYVLNALNSSPQTNLSSFEIRIRRLQSPSFFGEFSEETCAPTKASSCRRGPRCGAAAVAASVQRLWVCYGHRVQNLVQ